MWENSDEAAGREQREEENPVDNTPLLHRVRVRVRFSVRVSKKCLDKVGSVKAY